jgi:multidrug efflux pump subunit AcrA (membrane-fusion protein)
MVAAVMAIPVPIQIESTATLRPSKGTEIFASAEGTIEEVSVKDGQFVQKGEPLLCIDSPRLLDDYDEAKQKLEKSNEELILNQRLRNNRRLTTSEQDEIDLKIEASEKIIPIHAKSLARLEREIEKLTVRAPASGTIETRQVQEYLKQPVPMGKWLLSIREEDSQWELEAKIPERYLQELRNALQNESTSAIARMTSLPTQPLRLRVSDPITWRPVETGVTGTLDNREYKVRFTLENSLPTSVASTGASARVAITTGRGPLIWALSKDFIEDISARTAMWLR